MKNLMKAGVYVGTYRKYNNGSINGKWLNLASYNNKQEFFGACKRLHRNEADPEFMFQDYENVPESMIGESFISSEVWNVLSEMKKMKPERREQFCEWCEANGYEQDMQAVKEFASIKIKKNSLPHEFLLREEFAKIHPNSESMRKYCLGTISNCVKTSFGLVIFDKPQIETSFCFGYSDFGQGQTYQEARKAEKNFGEAMFLHKNLSSMKRELERFKEQEEGDPMEVLHFTKLYGGAANIYGTVFVSEWKAKNEIFWRGHEPQLASKEDFKKCYEAQKQEYEKFEKRLKSYLKRYGTSKLKTWTYWMDE